MKLFIVHAVELHEALSFVFEALLNCGKFHIKVHSFKMNFHSNHFLIEFIFNKIQGR
jgi:hypothetical protein